MIRITTHTLVKNEDKWVWFVLKPWVDYAYEMLVIDDHSSDLTVKVINSINSDKLKFEERIVSSTEEHTQIRNEMVAKTRTDWFLVLDGDEVWGRKTIEIFLSFLEKQPESTWAVAMHTRNCVGDVFHYLPEELGKYQLLGKKGHLTIRAYKKIPGFSWKGNYPLESFSNSNGQSINEMNSHLKFFDGFYWHMTHLQRSTKNDEVKGWRSKKYDMGVRVDQKEQFPEIFFENRPSFIADPLAKRSTMFTAKALVQSPFKILKRKLKE